MGDFDDLEGHDPQREDEVTAKPAKKEPPADKPTPTPPPKKSDDK